MKSPGSPHSSQVSDTDSIMNPSDPSFAKPFGEKSDNHKISHLPFDDIAASVDNKADLTYDDSIMNPGYDEALFKKPLPRFEKNSQDSSRCPDDIGSQNKENLDSPVSSQESIDTPRPKRRNIFTASSNSSLNLSGAFVTPDGNKKKRKDIFNDSNESSEDYSDIFTQSNSGKPAKKPKNIFEDTHQTNLTFSQAFVDSEADKKKEKRKNFFSEDDSSMNLSDAFVSNKKKPLKKRNTVFNNEAKGADDDLNKSDNHVKKRRNIFTVSSDSSLNLSGAFVAPKEKKMKRKDIFNDSNESRENYSHVFTQSSSGKPTKEPRKVFEDTNQTNLTFSQAFVDSEADKKKEKRKNFFSEDDSSMNLSNAFVSTDKNLVKKRNTVFDSVDETNENYSAVFSNSHSNKTNVVEDDLNLSNNHVEETMVSETASKVESERNSETLQDEFSIEVDIDETLKSTSATNPVDSSTKSATYIVMKPNHSVDKSSIGVSQLIHESSESVVVERESVYVMSGIDSTNFSSSQAVLENDQGNNIDETITPMSINVETNKSNNSLNFSSSQAVLENDQENNIDKAIAPVSINVETNESNNATNFSSSQAVLENDQENYIDKTITPMSINVETNKSNNSLNFSSSQAVLENDQENNIDKAIAPMSINAETNKSNNSLNFSSSQAVLENNQENNFDKAITPMSINVETNESNNSLNFSSSQVVLENNQENNIDKAITPMSINVETNKSNNSLNFSSSQAVLENHLEDYIDKAITPMSINVETNKSNDSTNFSSPQAVLENDQGNDTDKAITPMSINVETNESNNRSKSTPGSSSSVVALRRSLRTTSIRNSPEALPNRDASVTADNVSECNEGSFSLSGGDVDDESPIPDQATTSKGFVTVFSMSRIGRLSTTTNKSATILRPVINRKPSIRRETSADKRLKKLPSKPNFPTFSDYCNKRFYDHLISKMEPKSGIRVNNHVVKVAAFVCDIVRKIIASKDNYYEDVEKLKHHLFDKGIVVTHYNFAMFCYNFLPAKLLFKLEPMLQPESEYFPGDLANSIK